MLCELIRNILIFTTLKYIFANFIIEFYPIESNYMYYRHNNKIGKKVISDIVHVFHMLYYFIQL